MSASPAVLIVCFKRFQYIDDYFDLGIKVGITRFYIAVDGSENSVITERQREFVNQVNSKYKDKNIEIYWWLRLQNLGLAASMITALDWFFRFEESGIILEDDLLLSNEFFLFCLSGLKSSRNENLYSISGNQPISNLLNGKSNNCGNYPLVWGWATWRDRWIEIRKIYELSSCSIIRPSSSLGLTIFGFWFAGVMRVRSGILSSWALPFAAASRSRNWLHIYPDVNLVQNLGNDKDATHTFSNSGFTEMSSSLRFNPVNDRFCDERSAKAMTLSIEKNVYQIKFKHTFSPLAYLFTKAFDWTIRKDAFVVKLNEVEIPKFQRR
jgi:hypothetical protein